MLLYKQLKRASLVCASLTILCQLHFVSSASASVVHFRLENVRADGHCMYHAIAKGLTEAGMRNNGQPYTYQDLRNEAANYLENINNRNKQGQDLGDDDSLLIIDGTTTIERHINNVRSTNDWGSDRELAALSRALGFNYDVYDSSNNKPMFADSRKPGQPTILLDWNGVHYQVYIPTQQGATAQDFRNFIASKKPSNSSSQGGGSQGGGSQKPSSGGDQGGGSSQGVSSQKPATAPKAAQSQATNPAQKQAADLQVHKAHMSSSMRVVSTTHALLSSRMNIINNISVAPASGDNADNNFGLWVRANYGFGSSQGSSNDKADIKDAPYKTNNIGATIGLDFGQAQDKMLGIAYSYNNGSINYTNAKEVAELKEKDKLQTNLFSLYGLYYFNSNVHLDALASYGLTNITKEHYNNSKSTLKGKSNMIDALASLGYDLHIDDNVLLIPSVGLEYLNYSQNKLEDEDKKVSIAELKMNKFRVFAGLSLAGAANFNSGVMNLEVHSRFYQDLNSKITQGEKNAPLVMDSSDNIIMSRSNVNIGASMGYSFNASSNIGVGYDYYISKDLNYNSVFLKARIGL